MTAAAPAVRDLDERCATAEALRGELRRAGLLERKQWRAIAELAVHLSVMAAAITLYCLVPRWWVRGLALLVLTVGTLGLATNTHTATHGATSHRRWVNELIAYFGYPFCLGLSLTAWRHSHIAVHHRAPNVMGVDGDCDLAPWFAITRPQFDASRGLRRTYYRLQVLVLPLLISFDGFNRMTGSFRWLIGALRDPDRRSTAHWIDLAAMLGHPVLWLVIPSLVWSPVPVLTFYVLRVALVGYALFVAFAPGHFPAEAVCCVPATKSGDFFQRQLSATVNYHAGPIGSLVLSGLDYQIEHHIFPNISHVHYPALRDILIRYCREHGYPYHAMTWWQAVWKSVQVFIVPKPVDGDPGPAAAVPTPASEASTS